MSTCESKIITHHMRGDFEEADLQATDRELLYTTGYE